MTGRFTQEDVSYNDGLNLYAYCNSNPVRYVDPSGHCAKCSKENGVSGSKAEFIVENRVPLDRETILNTSDYVKTKIRLRGHLFIKKMINIFIVILYIREKGLILKFLIKKEII